MVRLFETLKSPSRLPSLVVIINVVLVLAIVLVVVIGWVKTDRTGSNPASSGTRYESRRLAVGQKLADLVYSPKNNKYYAFSQDTSQLFIVDAQSHAKEAPIELRLMSGQSIMSNYGLMSPHFWEVYVSTTSGLLLRISLDNYSVKSALVLPGYPTEIAVDPGSKYLFVLNETLGLVQVVDLVGFHLRKIIEVGSVPVSLDIDPEGEFLYVGDRNDGSVRVISVANLSLVGKIGFGRSIVGLEVVGDYLVILEAKNSNLLVVDRNNNQLVNQTTVIADPTDLVIDEELGEAYVLSASRSEIGLVDLSAFRQTESFRFSTGFALTGGRRKLIKLPGWEKLIMVDNDKGELLEIKVH